MDSFLETRGVLHTDVIENLAQMVRGMLRKLPDVPEVTCAASLAHHGLLGPVESMKLHYVDLTSVPEEHLASLVSCVTRSVYIQHVSQGLVSVLDSVASKELYLSGQSLDSDETRALMAALDTRVEELTLEGGWLTLALVMEALTESSGQGRCRLIMCYEDTAARYRDQLWAWASIRGWGVTQDNEYFVKIQRS